jgi:hypothetical protein
MFKYHIFFNKALQPFSVKLVFFLTQMREKMNRYGTFCNSSGPIQKSHFMNATE